MGMASVRPHNVPANHVLLSSVREKRTNQTGSLCDNVPECRKRRFACMIYFFEFLVNTPPNLCGPPMFCFVQAGR